MHSMQAARDDGCCACARRSPENKFSKQKQKNPVSMCHALRYASGMQAAPTRTSATAPAVRRWRDWAGCGRANPKPLAHKRSAPEKVVTQGCARARCPALVAPKKNCEQTETKRERGLGPSMRGTAAEARRGGRARGEKGGARARDAGWSVADGCAGEKQAGPAGATPVVANTTRK